MKTISLVLQGAGNGTGEFLMYWSVGSEEPKVECVSSNPYSSLKVKDLHNSPFLSRVEVVYETRLCDGRIYTYQNLSTGVY